MNDYILSIQPQPVPQECDFSSDGLTFLGMHDMIGGEWEFYVIGVWKGADGYYLGTDAGESIPTPFENYDSIEDLTGPLTAEQAKEEARSIFDLSLGTDPEGFEILMEQIV